MQLKLPVVGETTEPQRNPLILEHPNCPICLMREGIAVSQSHFFDYLTKILECPHCQIAWMEKQLSEKGLKQFYKHNYRYMKQERFDLSRYIGDLVRSRSQLSYWKDLVPRTARILEIGAAYGVNANYLYTQGYRNLVLNEWDSANFELHSLPRLQIDDRCLSEYPSASFDFIILSHVLEHFNNIGNTIETLLRLLAPGGLIFTEVPNAANPHVHRQMNKSFHYYFFTNKSLEQIWRRYGYRASMCQAFGKSELISRMRPERREEYAQAVMGDPFFDDIVALDGSHPKAFWLRAIIDRR